MLSVGMEQVGDGNGNGPPSIAIAGPFSQARFRLQHHWKP